MPTALQSQLAALAESFAKAVLDAIRSASLHDLSSDSGKWSDARRATREAAPTRAAPSRRLRRRSPADIATALGEVVSLVKGHKDGLRAEQIRAKLRMQSKEMPRVLAEGLAKRKLKKRGRKRATTYFAS